MWAAQAELRIHAKWTKVSDKERTFRSRSCVYLLLAFKPLSNMLHASANMVESSERRILNTAPRTSEITHHAQMNGHLYRMRRCEIKRIAFPQAYNLAHTEQIWRSALTRSHNRNRRAKEIALLIAGRGCGVLHISGRLQSAYCQAWSGAMGLLKESSKGPT